MRVYKYLEDVLEDLWDHLARSVKLLAQLSVSVVELLVHRRGRIVAKFKLEGGELATEVVSVLCDEVQVCLLA